jgi:hypothetical protein
MSSLDDKGSEKKATAVEHDLYGGEDAGDAIYNAKAHILNAAIQEVGMGWYQVRFSCFSSCSTSYCLNE